MLMVLKFGGTSLADAERLRVAARRIAGEIARGNRVVAVVSAQGDATDRILETVRSLHPDPPMRELDACLATGEQMSAAMMAMTLEALGCPAVSLTGPQAGLLTDGIHGNARVLGLGSDRIARELAAGKAVVVAGFQGIRENGDITTLGRGGSDTTAVALAAFLGAGVCRIYTDVDGVYDRDPRIFPQAVKLETVDYGRMLAMARQGAQVLHDRCVELAMEYGVPLQVLSSFRPGSGTLVCADAKKCAQFLEDSSLPENKSGKDE